MSNARTLASLIDGSNIVVPNGYGLDFGTSTTGTGTVTGGVMDDYEEGSWNPTFSFNGVTTGVIGSYVGRYSKIGDTVSVWASITLTSKGSQTGSVVLGGLPFASINASAIYYKGVIGAGRINTGNSVYYVFEGVPNSSYGFFVAYYTNTSGNKIYVSDSHIANNSFFCYQLTYRSA